MVRHLDRNNIFSATAFLGLSVLFFGLLTSSWDVEAQTPSFSSVSSERTRPLEMVLLSPTSPSHRILLSDLVGSEDTSSLRAVLLDPNTGEDIREREMLSSFLSTLRLTEALIHSSSSINATMQWRVFLPQSGIEPPGIIVLRRDGSLLYYPGVLEVGSFDPNTTSVDPELIYRFSNGEESFQHPE